MFWKKKIKSNQEDSLYRELYTTLDKWDGLYTRRRELLIVSGVNPFSYQPVNTIVKICDNYIEIYTL